MFKEQNHLFILPIYHGRVEDINNIKHGRTQLKGALNAPCMLHWIDDDFELNKTEMAATQHHLKVIAKPLESNNTVSKFLKVLKTSSS